jgi:hypothetical protein
VLEYEQGYWHDDLQIDLPTRVGTRLQYDFKRGKYLAFNTSFYRCAGAGKTCDVGRHSGSVTCSEGNHGVLCGVCDAGFVATLTGECTKCNVDGTNFLQGGWALLIIVAIIGISLAISQRVYRKYGDRLEILSDELTSKFKITIAFFSIVLLVGGVYEVMFPLAYLNFLSFFSVLEFDFLRMFMFHCFIEYDAHSAMYGFSIAMLLLLFIVVVGLVALQKASSSATAASDTSSTAASDSTVLRKVVGFLLLLTYFVYPFGCKMLFATFNCIEVDTRRYLRSDLSIDCASEEHERAKAFAGFMIAAFPIGLPALYFSMLRLNRDKLFADSSSMDSLSFFYREYDEAYYYWESIECLRKCLLMGFASFFKPGTLMQLIIVIVITVLYGYVLAVCKPYKDPADDTLAITTQIMLFLTLLGALMIKFDQGFAATGIYEEGYDTALVNTLLIGSAALVATSAVGSVAVSVAKQFCRSAEGTLSSSFSDGISEATATEEIGTTNNPKLVV